MRGNSLVISVIATSYRKISNTRRTLVGNEIVDHSDVVGASPVGAAPTTSSFSTWHLASMDSAKTGARQSENLFKCWDLVRLILETWRCVESMSLHGRHLVVMLDLNTPWRRQQIETFFALLALCEKILWSPVDSINKGQWCGALAFSLISAWTNSWANTPVIWDAIALIMMSL